MSGSNKGRPRIKRTDQDLGEAFLNHLRLLQEFGTRAFEQGDEKYLGEVAGKLRLLCYRQGRNRPLLLDLMARYASQVQVVSNSPPEVGKTRTLEEYLDELAMVIPGPSGRVVISNKQLIGNWSQQHGASHEDWEHDEAVVAARSQPVVIGGLHASAACLRSVYRTVLSVADAFLRELHAKGIIKPMAET